MSAPGSEGGAVEEPPELVLIHEVPRGFKPGPDESLFDRACQTVLELFEIRLYALVLVKPGSLPARDERQDQRRECRRQYQADELATVRKYMSPAVQAPAAPASEQPTACAVMTVRDWLIQRFAQQLNMPPASIDVERPFAAYGLDSVAMLAMAADLEKWLGRRVSPTELYSTPTIATLARHLGGLGSKAMPGEAVPAAAAKPQTGPQPIAVVGIGCRLPQCDGPEQFWQALRKGAASCGALRRALGDVSDAVTSTQGGYLAEVQQIDAAFFGIAPREAIFIDPQHRLLLETDLEALEHAGCAGPVGGHRHGSLCRHLDDRLQPAPPGAHRLCGCLSRHRQFAEHGGDRLSYHLDLHGPSMAVDTACSASLVAVHLACQSSPGRMRPGGGRWRQPDAGAGHDRSADARACCRGPAAAWLLPLRATATSGAKGAAWSCSNRLTQPSATAIRFWQFSKPPR